MAGLGAQPPPDQEGDQLPLRYELVCFDLDGTLVDTASEICEAANLALESHGIARQPELEITHLIGAGTRELMRRLLARCAVEQPAAARHASAPEALFESFDRHYERTTGTRAQPYPGARAALQRLRAAGLRVACVTNKETRHAVRVLAATGLEAYFVLLIGGDTLAHKKPHASVLQHAMTRLAASAGRTAHVGDSWIDVAAARNAGVQAWAVGYGYNAGEPIAAAAPDQLFDSLPAVAAHALAGR